MTTPGRPASQACADALVGQLVAQGVTEIVVAPGSRSAPLALAAFEADRRGLARLHVRTDERSAGFLALGLGKASGIPAAVVTTSGTAVANLLPAVMEAHHAGVGLVVVTADRPAAMVGFGANQATDQAGLFDRFVRFSARVTALAPAASWTAQAARACVLAAGSAGAGPVHLNVELVEPLVAADPDGGPDPRPLLDRRRPRPAPVLLDAAVRTVIVAGDAPPAVGRAWAATAEDARVPLIAEPSANARRGGAALACGRLLLGTGLADEVERVVVVGHPTLSRPVTRLLGRADVAVVVVADDDWPDPGWRARLVAGAVEFAGSADASWLGRWLAADAEASARVAGLTAPEGDGAGDTRVSGWELARRVWARCSGGLLVAGASQGLRDLDLTPIAPDPPEVYANRGLSGIDGTVSTAAGVALAAGRPVTLLCGDLTFLHDSNGLAIGPGEPRPDLRVVVADDAGGAIFATLEYGADEFASAFERMFATPPGVDLAALAASYGARATAVATLDELDAALSAPVRGIEVVVVAVDRTRRRETDRRLRDADGR